MAQPDSRRLVYGEDDRVGGWIFPRFGGEWVPGRAKTIGLEVGGDLAAGVAFENFNGASVFASLAVDDQVLVGQEFLVAAFAYPFEQLKVNKIIAMVDSVNQKAKDLVDNLGFTFEHYIADAHPAGALLVYSMTRKECRFLGGGSHG